MRADNQLSVLIQRTCVENISQPGLRRCQPSGLRGDAWVSEFQSTQHAVNACVVSSRGFGGAAGFSVFLLWVQEGAAQSALAEILSTLCFQVFFARW